MKNEMKVYDLYYDSNLDGWWEGYFFINEKGEYSLTEHTDPNTAEALGIPEEGGEIYSPEDFFDYCRYRESDDGGGWGISLSKSEINDLADILEIPGNLREDFFGWCSSFRSLCYNAIKAAIKESESHLPEYVRAGFIDDIENPVFTPSRHLFS